MKLKNSYILLVVMAIFLLVGIGSVCASEDVTADNDVQLAGPDADVVLDEGETTFEKVKTEITADDNKQYNEKDTNKNVTVTIKDNESNPIQNITKTNLTVTENKTAISFDYNNSIITFKDLKVGEHNLNITYLGNELYNSSSTLIKLTIIKDNYLELPATVETEGNTAEINIKLTDGIHDNTYLLNDSNTKITLKYGNETENITVNWEDVVANNNFIVNVANKVPATVIVNYTGENNKTTIKNIGVKFKTHVEITPTTMRINEKENTTFNVKVIGADGNQVNITGNDLIISADGGKATFNQTTGDITVSNLKKGVRNLTITYKGNNVNNTSKNYVLINVWGEIDINLNKTSVNVNSSKKGEIVITNITNGIDLFNFTKDNFTINVTYKDGNDTKVIEITSWELNNHTITFVLENGNFTTATLIIDYGNVSSRNVTLNRIYNAKIDVLNKVNEYQNGNFTIKLTDIDDETLILADKEVSLTVIGNIRAGFSAKTNSEGIATFKTVNIYEFDNANSTFTMKQLEVGDHNVEIGTKSPVISNKTTTNFTITKANINITIEPFNEIYGTAENVTITVTNAKDGAPVPSTILHLYMPQTSGKNYYFMTDSNGQSKISVTQLIPGTYNVTVNNNDTKNINNKTADGKITIQPIPVKLTVTLPKTYYYNTGNIATVKVTDKATGKVVPNAIILVQVYTGKNSQAYLYQANSKGIVTINYAPSAVGSHKIVISSADTRYKASAVTKTVYVKKASVKITAPKVTSYYKGGKYLTIKVTNTKNSKPIYLAKLNIKIFISSNRYYNYNGQTGLDGKLRISLDTFKPGTYKVIVSKGESKNFTAKQVTTKFVVKKAPAKLTPAKLTAKKGTNKYFKVTVKNTKTKKVIKGVKVKMKVYTGKSSKTYTVKTNSKGIAQLNVKSLKVGTHKVVVSSGNKYVTAKTATSSIKITKT